MNFTISLVQMNIRFGKPNDNMKRAAQMIDTAAKEGATSVLLPELWSSGYDLENAHKHATFTPEILEELHRLADSRQIFIGGSLLESTPEGIYNTFYWISPLLEMPVSYRKIHLFRLMAEDQWLLPGNQFSSVPAPWGLTGLAICYDLRFPELFRHYAVNGARAILLPAEWPIRRIDHWKILLRARAIENQCFIFAANCVGASPKDHFGGFSAIISPWGETLAEGSSSEEAVVTAQIDTDQLEQARELIPVFQDRRPNVYS